MSTEYEIQANLREDTGKADSRRQRRLSNNVPAIIYGEKQAPLPILINEFLINKLTKNEGFYSHILTIKLDNDSQHKVVLKAVQRHPAQPKIMHLDFLRVSDKSVLTKTVPIHFINELNAVGVKKGGIISHIVSKLEIKCLAKNLPEFIEIDIESLDLEQVWHLSEIKFPENITIPALKKNPNLPVVSIHKPKAHDIEPEETTKTEATETTSEETTTGTENKK